MKTRVVRFKVSDRQHRRVAELAREEGLSMSDLIRTRLGLPVACEAKELPPVEGTPDAEAEPGAAALKHLRGRLGQD